MKAYHYQLTFIPMKVETYVGRKFSPKNYAQIFEVATEYHLEDGRIILITNCDKTFEISEVSFEKK